MPYCAVFLFPSPKFPFVVLPRFMKHLSHHFCPSHLSLINIARLGNLRLLDRALGTFNSMTMCGSVTQFYMAMAIYSSREKGNSHFIDVCKCCLNPVPISVLRSPTLASLSKYQYTRKVRLKLCSESRIN